MSRARQHNRDDIFGPPVRFLPVFLNVDGNPTTALFLSQAYWWQQQADSGSGFGTEGEHGKQWFWKTQSDFKEVTGLSRHYQRKARESLKSMPWYNEKQLGMPAKLHFHIDIANLKIWALGQDPDVDLTEADGDNALSEEGPRTSERNDLGQGRGGSSGKGEEGPRTDSQCARDHRLQTETTSETTSSSTTDAHEPSGDPPPPESDPQPDNRSAELRELAAEHDLDLNGREPFTADERLDVSQLQTEAQRVLEVYWSPFKDKGLREQMRVVCAFCSAEEIRDALQTTKTKVPDSKWPYFATVALSVDEDSGGTKSAGKSTREKYRDKFGVGGGGQ